MNLDLDPRQRAMLQEMGVQVWWPAADQALAAAPAAPPPAPCAALPAAAPRSQSTTSLSTAPMAAQAAPTSARAAPPPQPPAAHPAFAGTDGAAMAPPSWVLRAPQPLFPHADPARTPANLGAGWLLVAEDAGGSAPFAGEAGRLLHNMLHALRLHRHPRVFLCTLQAPGLGDPALAAAAAPCADALATAVATVQPSVVLVMGRAAARAVLGRSEPLGQLRGAAHTVAGVPAVVSYDTPYLLRAPPATKALAWADLCRARALAAGDDNVTAA